MPPNRSLDALRSDRLGLRGRGCRPVPERSEPWRDHIGFCVDYTGALAKKDEAGQQAAVDNLTGYTDAFSGFLAEATGLPQDAHDRDTLAAAIIQQNSDVFDG